MSRDELGHVFAMAQTASLGEGVEAIDPSGLVQITETYQLDENKRTISYLVNPKMAPVTESPLSARFRNAVQRLTDGLNERGAVFHDANADQPKQKIVNGIEYFVVDFPAELRPRDRHWAFLWWSPHQSGFGAYTGARSAK